MNFDGRRPNAFLLVPGMDSILEGKSEADLALSWHVDALLVAIARAAMAHRWRILMPADVRFAPLVADVVAEYSVAREAEPTFRDVEDRVSNRPMGFVTLTGPPASQANRATAAISALGSLLAPHVALGAVDDLPQRLDDVQERNSVQGMLVVGNGPKVRQARQLGRRRQIQVYRLLDDSFRQSKVANPADDIASQLSRELEGLRKELVLIHPTLGEHAERREPAAPPPDFWRYPAYPLFAERLLSSMSEGTSRAQ